MKQKKTSTLNQTNEQGTAPENKTPVLKTFADADFPEMKLVPNDNSLISELCGSFVVFLLLWGFWAIIANFFKSLFGFGDSDNCNSGASTSYSRSYSSRSYSSSSRSSSSSSSSSGHGGSFGGGGASR